MFKIFLGIIAVLVGMNGCAYQVDGDQTTEENDMNIIGAQLTDMSRTTVAGAVDTGLPVGTPNRSLMQTDLDPGEYTIQFSVEPPSDGEGFAAYAVVSWKVAGHQLRRLVSVASGAVISGVADAVDVQIVDVSGASLASAPHIYPPLANGNPDPRQLYKVAATLSRGSRPSLNQPGTLASKTKSTLVLAGNAQLFNVPQDAGVISVYIFAALPSNAGDSPNQILGAQVDAASAILSRFSPTNGGWIPLISGCIAINVVNNSAHDQNINVLWGIDG